MVCRTVRARATSAASSTWPREIELCSTDTSKCACKTRAMLCSTPSTKQTRRRGSFGCEISENHSTDLKFRGGREGARLRGHHRSSGRTLIWPLMSTGAGCTGEVFPPSKGVFRTAGDRDAPGYAAGFSTWRQHEAEALIKYPLTFLDLWQVDDSSTCVFGGQVDDSST